MPKRKSHSKQESSDKIVREILSSLLFALGLFSSLSLVFYSSRIGLDLKGSMGTTGVFISAMLSKAFGICGFAVPIVLFYTAAITFINKSGPNLLRNVLSSLVLLISVMTFLGLSFTGKGLLGYETAGGWIGNAIAEKLKEGIAGTIGSYLIVTVLLILSLVAITGLTLSEMLRTAGKVSASATNKTYEFSKFIAIQALRIGKRLKEPLENLKGGRQVAEENLQTYEGDQASTLNRRQNPSSDEIIDLEEEVFTDEETLFLENGRPEIVIEQPKSKGFDEFSLVKKQTSNSYKVPPLDLLDSKIEIDLEVDSKAVYEKQDLIEEKLKDFGVSGKVVRVRPGPVITMFEYKPAPGIKISKIASLDNDLAMGLSALSIRIIAPIPGKDVIGIEVPNTTREMVVLRELLEDAEFSRSQSILTLALGKDISGLPFYMDLRKAPHLMVAGTTGSGKSVLLNAVITSMLYKASPHELKFIMIDPKMLELSVYEGIPHLLHPVVTEPKRAAAALKWAVGEMEKRYRTLSDEGVRDIETHNRNVENLDIPTEDKIDRLLPYIVIILDELADLMMIAPSEVKESVTRLSQKARAAGIHLIVATQRPSADVVAGLIKANFPARISFLVSSKIDSRIILDAGGAEQLLGKGDMLLLEPGTSNLLRLQGALISDTEREKITEHIKHQGSPDYKEEITHVEEKEKSEDLENEKDDLYYKALRTIAETNQASISMLQRKLRIGYNRAARIVEIMEKEGVVGPQEVAGKPREVFIDLNQTEERKTN